MRRSNVVPGKVLTASAVVSIGVLIAGCGSSSSTSSGTTQAHASTAPAVNSGKQYLADVAPANAALSTFAAAFKAWSRSNGTVVQTTAFVTPAVAAMQTLNQKLLAQAWPTNARADVHALVAADSAVSGDMAGLPSLNALSVSHWVTQFNHDTSVGAAAAKTVRSDLGPPPSNS